jgi:cyanate permease
MNMGGNLGGALSPILTPFLAQRLGWEGALYVAAALALLGALLWLGVHPERAIELGEGETKNSPLRMHEQEMPGVPSPATAPTRVKR